MSLLRLIRMNVTLLDLFERGDAAAGFIDSRMSTQKRHALFAGQTLDLGSGAAIENQFPDAVAQIEQFVNGGAPTISGSAALKAAGSFHQLKIAPFQPGSRSSYR